MTPRLWGLGYTSLLVSIVLAVSLSCAQRSADSQSRRAKALPIYQMRAQGPAVLLESGSGVSPFGRYWSAKSRLGRMQIGMARPLYVRDAHIYRYSLRDNTFGASCYLEALVGRSQIPHLLVYEVSGPTAIPPPSRRIAVGQQSRCDV